MPGFLDRAGAQVQNGRSGAVPLKVRVLLARPLPWTLTGTLTPPATVTAPLPGPGLTTRFESANPFTTL